VIGKIQGKNKNLFTANKPFKNVGTAATDQNYIDEEIKEQIKFRECLLPFCAESSVFASPL